MTDHKYIDADNLKRGEEHEWVEYRAPYCETCGAKMDGKES